MTGHTGCGGILCLEAKYAIEHSRGHNFIHVFCAGSFLIDKLS